MCGGTLDLPDGVTFGECPYCGSATTFPKLSDDRKEALYNRAEHQRRQCDFDKALETYEKLVEMDPSDPEIYWGMVLCRYGIEYVEDPVSHERIPTCHRVQMESILQDSDYLSALEHAAGDSYPYENEAKRIAEIQKDILRISAQEKPFDVFICYKETTEGGSRTPDSVVAQDIYYQLTNEGYRVFFSRITLEDKLGQQYEPYIFAALQSAKVMLVIGTKKEYFNAVWVKNEWSRFLALMKKDRSKMLIPCYKDMDAYDIPDELSLLQSQDMSKIGFIQDLLRGVGKVLKMSVAPTSAAGGAPLTGKNNPKLRRAQLFLENEDFDKALEYCEKVLDDEPENGYAYFLRLMAENKFHDELEIFFVESLEDNKTFQLARRFADPELASKLDGFLQKLTRIREALRQQYLQIIDQIHKDPNDAKAQYELGKCFCYGHGVQKNEAEAAKWYRKAAELGNAEAQCMLGKFYYWGSSVPKNEAEAAKWYRKAAEQGYADAQYELGNCYYFGSGVPEDKAEAEIWYRMAAEQGNSDAQSRLGDCCEICDSASINESPAAKYLLPGDSDLIRQALEIIITEQKASTSYLQRRLGIGYNESAELMDELEKRGIVSAPLSGGQKREILITDGLGLEESE
jgi:TPR repeat protein